MPASPAAERWARARVAQLAPRYFPGQEDPVWDALRTAAGRHEAAWRRSREGIYRPTVSMYAMALSWQLERQGPTCAICRGPLVPAGPGRTVGAARGLLSLGPRVLPAHGGRNVPQNLLLGHPGCLTAP
ncbi:MAG: hypothetical protein QXG65_05200 [Thermoplasmata archaeon]